MSAILPSDPWETALRLLTVLPPPYGESHGDVNFFCAGRFRQNGHRLFNEQIAPLLREGRELTVLLGFVDASVTRTTGLGGDDALLPAAAEFRAARLYDAAADAVFELTLSD